MDTRGSASIEYLAIATLVAMGGMVAWGAVGSSAARSIADSGGGHAQHGAPTAANPAVAEAPTGIVPTTVRLLTVPIRASLERVRRATAESQSHGQGAFGYALTRAAISPVLVAREAATQVRDFAGAVVSAVSSFFGSDRASGQARDDEQRASYDAPSTAAGTTSSPAAAPSRPPSTEEVLQQQNEALENPPPIKPGELAKVGKHQMRVVTLNAANGAKNDRYRTDENWTAVAHWLKATRASVVGLQENDFGNNPRTRGLNSALETIAKIHPEFSVFLDYERTGNAAARTFNEAEDPSANEATCPPPCSAGLPPGSDPSLRYDKHHSPDTRVFRTTAGTLIEGTSLNHRGPYGNAMFVDSRYEVVSAQTRVLRGRGTTFRNADANFRGDPDSPEGLAAMNDAYRAAYKAQECKTCREPRSALVVTVRDRQTGEERTIINAHLTQPAHDEDYVDRHGKAHKADPKSVQRAMEKQREAQLADLRDMAEGAMSQGQKVVVMGDLNMNSHEAGEILAGSGLKHAAGNDFDQVWVSQKAKVKSEAELDVRGSASGPITDHDQGSTVTF